MSEIKYRKGDYIRCESRYSNDVYIVKLLEDPYKDEYTTFTTIRAKVEILSINHIKVDCINHEFIIKGEYYTSKKVNYMNTALYKVLYKGEINEE